MLGTIAIPAQFVTAYAWGCVVDRYGSRPVMSLCLVLSSIFTVGWVLMPRGAETSWTVAILLTIGANLFIAGVVMGDQRMLFVNVTPEDRRGTYLAVYSAWMGLIGGLSPIVLGKMIDVGRFWSGHIGPVPIDAYTPLLFFGMLLTFVSASFYASVKTGEPTTVRDLLRLCCTAVPRWIQTWRNG